MCSRMEVAQHRLPAQYSHQSGHYGVHVFHEEFHGHSVLLCFHYVSPIFIVFPPIPLGSTQTKNVYNFNSSNYLASIPTPFTASKVDASSLSSLFMVSMLASYFDSLASNTILDPVIIGLVVFPLSSKNYLSIPHFS